MDLYIQIRDGQPYEHPIHGDNFRNAFPHIDTENLPPEFAKFIRVEKPIYDRENFKVVGNEPVYEWVNGVVQDVWPVRDMTQSEKDWEIADATEQVAIFTKTWQDEVRKLAEVETRENVKAAYLEYVAMLDTYVVKNIFKPVLPMLPKFSADGVLLTNELPGGSPSVFG